MNTVIGQRQKCQFDVELNGIVYHLGMMIPGNARKRVHHMVRNFIMNQWKEKHRNVETTALLKADGREYGSVYGFHRDRNIGIIHF